MQANEDDSGILDWLYRDPLVTRLLKYCKHYAVCSICLVILCILTHMVVGGLLLYYVYQASRTLTDIRVILSKA